MVLLADRGCVEAFGFQQGVLHQQLEFARHIEGVMEVAQEIVSGLGGPIAIGQPKFISLPLLNDWHTDQTFHPSAAMPLT